MGSPYSTVVIYSLWGGHTEQQGERSSKKGVSTDGVKRRGQVGFPIAIRTQNGMEWDTKSQNKNPT